MTAFKIFQGVFTKVLSVVALVVTLHDVCEAQTQTTCQSTFVNTFMQCVTNSSLDFQNFMWFARDGISGQQPPDIFAFTQQTCPKEQALIDCSARIVSRVQAVATTVCSDSDKNGIAQFHQNIFVNIHKKCAHPCREQLVPSLRQCYITAGLNATLFRPNITLPRYNLFGDTNDILNTFCSMRISLLQCMQTNVAGCPESSQILASIGLDLQSLNETISLLCDNRQLYLLGARCSANLSTEEAKCQATLMMELKQLESQLQTLSINQSVFVTEICRIRMDHTRCELYAMSRRDNVTKCPDAVLGLRREQECAYLPDTCNRALAERVIDMCDPVRFQKDKRQNFLITASLTSGAAFQEPIAYLLLAMSVLFYSCAHV